MAVSTTIPDLILSNTLNKCLTIVRNDYNNATDKALTILFNIFQQLQLDRYGMFLNAVNLLITTPENPKHIVARLSYDSSSSKYPSIHITMPSESDSRNDIGIGEGDLQEIVIDNGISQPQYVRQFSRRFNTTYQVVIMSDNKNEVILLYHLFKALIVSCYEHLELSGLNNIRMSGGDLSFSPNVPDKTFIRHIALNFDYNTNSVEFALNNIIDKITFQVILEESESDSGV